MEAKKNPKVDLTKKTGLFLNIGLVISLVAVITAFEWKFYDEGDLMDLGQVNDEFEDVMEIPPTEQPPPPPPKRAVTTRERSCSRVVSTRSRVGVVSTYVAVSPSGS